MRRGAITAIAVATLCVAATPATAEMPAKAAAAKAPFPARVQILTRSQAQVIRSGQVVARVAFKGRGVVRLRGRIAAVAGKARRQPRLFGRPLQPRKRGTRTVRLKLTRKGRAVLRRVAQVCGSANLEVTGTFRSGHRLARGRQRRGGRRFSRLGRKRPFRAQQRALGRDLERCLPGTAPGGAGGGYRVGVAQRDINPGADGKFAGGTVFLGGYGFGNNPVTGSRPADGILGDGIHVRALAVSDGKDAFAIADMETQGWFTATKDGPYGIVDMRQEVERRTGGALKASQVVVQSDHTHAGPDTIGVWGGVPVAYRKMIVDRTVEAIVEAFQTQRPGTLYYGRAPGRDLLSNQFDYDEANKYLDSDVRVLQAREPSGKPFATLLNFSAHTTVLGGSNQKVSGDWVQAANALLAERFGGEAMTVVATLGRTQPADRGCGAAPEPPKGPARDLCSIRAYAERVAERAEDAAVAAEPLGGDPVVAARSYLIQDAASSGLILGLNYAGDPGGAPINRALTPPWLTGNVLGTVAASARVGDVLLSTFPGEAYPQIAREISSRVPARGHMTAGLAQDQLGYLIAPYEAYPEPIRRSFFNQQGDEVSPIDNDNYFFNVSHTMGERVVCSALRGAGEVFGKGSSFRDARAACAPFANDALQPPGADSAP